MKRWDQLWQTVLQWDTFRNPALLRSIVSMQTKSGSWGWRINRLDSELGLAVQIRFRKLDAPRPTIKPYPTPWPNTGKTCVVAMLPFSVPHRLLFRKQLVAKEISWLLEGYCMRKLFKHKFFQEWSFSTLSFSFHQTMQAHNSESVELFLKRSSHRGTLARKHGLCCRRS